MKTRFSQKATRFRASRSLVLRRIVRVVTGKSYYYFFRPYCPLLGCTHRAEDIYIYPLRLYIPTR